MRSSTPLFIAGVLLQSAAATGFFDWNKASSFSCPANTDNKCNDQQKSGWDFGSLALGSFSSYSSYSFDGFTCSDSKGKRGLLTKRGGFGGKCISGKASQGKGPTFSGGSSSDSHFSTQQYYVTVDRDVDVEFHYSMPDGSKCSHVTPCKGSGTVVKNSQCGGATSVSFQLPSHEKGDCGINLHGIDFDCSPPQQTPPKPSYSKPAPPPVSSKVPPPPQSSRSPPEPSKVPSPPENSKTPPESSRTPPESSKVPPPPESSRTPPESSKVLPLPESSRVPPPESSRTSPEPSKVPPPSEGSKSPAEPSKVPPPSYNSKPQPGPSSQPADDVPSSSPAAGPSSAPPSGPASSSVAGPVPSSAGPSPPVPTSTCPDVLPKCLSTWMFSNACSGNTDHDCFCQDDKFIANIYQCLSAWGETDDEIQAAVTYLVGICGAHIPSNPGIITNCPSSITIQPTPQPSAQPGPGTAPQPAPQPVTTITVSQTISVPITYTFGSSKGETIPSSFTQSTIQTVLTVPQVAFTTAASGVALVPGPSSGLAAGPTGVYPAATTLATGYPLANATASIVPFLGAAPRMAGSWIAGTVAVVAGIVFTL